MPRRKSLLANILCVVQFVFLQEFSRLFRFDFEHGHGLCTVQPGFGSTLPIGNGRKVGVERGNCNRLLDLQENAIICTYLTNYLDKVCANREGAYYM